MIGGLIEIYAYIYGGFPYITGESPKNEILVGVDVFIELYTFDAGCNECDAFSECFCVTMSVCNDAS